MYASDNVKTGRLKATTSANKMPNVPCNLVKIKALSSNAASIYIGNSTVTLPVGGGSDETTGFELAPGDESGWLPISNLEKLYRIGNNESDQLTYLALAP